MTHLRQRMIEDMKLAGLSTKTQELYIAAVYGLAKHYMRSPDQLSEEDIRTYLLYLKDEKRRADGTLRICYYGIKFFYINTLRREWPVLKLVRSPRKRRLPTILSLGEVKKLLGQVRIQRNRMCLTLIYACGLRISEATKLRVTDIDSKRMVIKIQGKGQKDRLVPLPRPLLFKMREYWKIDRSKTWLFPGHNPEKPVSNHSVRRAMYKAAGECGLKKPIVPHSLRHTYATHLLEHKVDIRIIQILLGHKHLKTTAIYTHLTPQTLKNVRVVLQRLTNDL
ncbi:MAG: site-specific integrase [Pseudomonadota bacterium]